MTKKPLVSVIIPTVSNDKYLDKCLTSIKKQTYKNLETVVANLGLERNYQRNWGAKRARGKYLLFIDADMELSAKVVEQCVNLAEGEGDLAGIIIPEVSFGEGFWAQCKKLERSFYVGVDWIEAARFFNKRAYNKTGGYDGKMISGEDWDLSQRVCKYGKLKRISAFIHHNEGSPSLEKIISKKFYYAQKFDEYTRKKANQKYLRLQTSVFQRYKLFLSRPQKLFANPLLGIGMLWMKSLEFSLGAIGYTFKRNNYRTNSSVVAVVNPKILPKLSIIIPTLNAQEYLPLCLESIKKQDYPSRKVEVIIVDGGSTDNTLAIVQKYGARIINNSKKIAEYGKTIGIKSSTGKYFILLDSDNEIIENNWLKLMVNPMLKEKQLFGVESPLAHDNRLSGLNRYFARMRIADPLARYLASKPVNIEKKEGYEIMHFSAKAVLITGANGFLWNKDLVMKNQTWLEKFEEANYSTFIHRKTGMDYAIPYGVSVRHYYCDGIFSYIKKRAKIATKISERIRNREYTWLMLINKIKFLVICLFLVTLIGPALEAIYRFVRERTTDWFWHPVISFLTIVIYLFYTIKSLPILLVAALGFILSLILAAIT